MTPFRAHNKPNRRPGIADVDLVSLQTHGLPDAVLEDLCGEAHGKSEGLGRGYAPWLFGLSELHSQGKCWRTVLGWPQWLPVPVFSDHGVHFDHEFFPQEQENGAQVHLTWSDWRVGQSLPGKVVLRTMHPWVLYRRFTQIQPQTERSGTLVFINHTRMSTEHEPYDWDKYFLELRDMDEEFRPRGIMFHANDVRKGVHKKFKQYGLPIFTAGNTSSPLFVDRFYRIVGLFKFSTSPSLGSHSFLSEEFGVNFFLSGEKLVHNFQDDLRREPNYRIRKHFLEHLFSFPPGPTWEKEAALHACLSTNLSVGATVRSLRKLFIRQSLRLPQIAKDELLMRKKFQGRLTRKVR